MNQDNLNNNQNTNIPIENGTNQVNATGTSAASSSSGVSQQVANVGQTLNNNPNNVDNSNVGVINTQGNIPDPNQNVVTDENLKRVNIDYKPPSKFKTFLLIVFFIALIAFIFFLPEIQAYLAEFNAGDTKTVEITSGKMTCKLATNTKKLDKTVERVFTFTDKKLESAKYITTTKGDVTEDATTLDEMAERCKLIKSSLAGVEGITVACEYSEGKLIQRENIDFKKYNSDTVQIAYIEAGGSLSEFEYGYDINQLQKTMLQAGFTCVKEA